MISIILAGGLGKRMNSEVPKVLHIVNGKPMICHVIDRALELNSEKILIILGKYKEIIKQTISEYITTDKICYIIQDEPLGTGNAIMSCIPFLKNINTTEDQDFLILSGDVPLIKYDTLMYLTNFKKGVNCLLSFILENPKGYGRILSNEKGEIEKIIEEKDCTDIQREITSVNCGIYSLNFKTLLLSLKIQNENMAKEYYLTELIELAYKDGQPFHEFFLLNEKKNEIANINTKEDLETINNFI
jgi:UDP-N-acetylglucosamine diphosphorylase/glucosamine-1-phosphate N-acetyltransferase